MNDLGTFIRQFSRGDRGIYEVKKKNKRFIAYSELYQSALELSASWRTLKLRERFIAVVWMEQSLDGLRSFLAVVLAGGIPVPMHSFSAVEDISGAVRRLEADMVVVSTAKFRMFHSSLSLMDVQRSPYWIDLDTGRLLAGSDGSDASHGSGHGGGKFAEREYTPPTETAVIFMSSGSTGWPKGIMLSDHNIISNVESIQDYVWLNRGDKLLAFKSLGYCSSITGEWLTALFAGCDLQLTDAFMHPFEMLRFVREYGTTFMCTVPSAILPLVKTERWGEKDVASLRKMTIVGGPMPSDSLLHLSSRMPSVELMPSYGLTEASPRVTYLPAQQLKVRPGSVGIPVKGVQVSVYRSGVVAEPGEHGEIVVTGPNVMLGYYNNDRLTSEQLKPEGLYTSDIGYIDQDGFIYITGRMDNALNVGGHTVYPETIERILLGLPFVREVAVTGVADDIWGERMVAFVVLSDGNGRISELAEFSKLHLQPVQRPRKWIIVDEQQLPRTIVGKINRLALRTMAKEWEDAATFTSPG
ncbi:class I adenylate-forming enzyme family protein [Paenibacillus aceti]|uniref:class I adenylate-forming enzyme family protein n=1 Tax=Paenibacillus aceti TaxID=1820010 RepID=UPI000EA10B43|nr:class I adenylate-forming enzyme family protein [Paenibacillus aceti]